VTIATETFWLADRNKDRQPAPQKDSRANQPGFVVLARFFDTLCCRCHPERSRWASKANPLISVLRCAIDSRKIQRYRQDSWEYLRV